MCKQIRSKVTTILHIVGPKRPSGNCYVCCCLTDKTALIGSNFKVIQNFYRKGLFTHETSHSLNHWQMLEIRPSVLLKFVNTNVNFCLEVLIVSAIV